MDIRDDNVVNTCWSQLLEELKHHMDEQVLNSLITTNLVPTSYSDHQLTIYSMADYKKPILLSNPSIMNTLQSLAKTIFQDDQLELHIISSTMAVEPTAPPLKVTEERPTFTETVEKWEPSLEQHLPEEAYDVSDPLPVEFDEDEEYQYDDPVVPSMMTPPTHSGNLFDSSDFELAGTDATPPLYYEDPIDNELVLKSTNLKKDYTFENFIFGEANLYAYTIAKSIAESTDTKYNPFYIYGKSGVGKTHLMHAIGHETLRLRPNSKVIAITSENFLNAFVESIQTKKNSAFREKFRNADLLLIDDIQFLEESKYNSTQKEFFHTFNQLLDHGKKIILTSDMGPNELKMEDRLITRFKSGIYQEISLPDSETIMAIIRSEIDKNRVTYPQLQISQDTILFFGNNFDKTNVRDIKGAFNKLIFHAEIKNRLDSIDLEFAKQALEGVIKEPEAEALSMNLIIEVVSDYYKIKKELILGQKRTKHIAIARQIAMYLCRDMVNESYPQIALAFGKKDHTTSLHAYDKISAELEKPGDIKRTVEEIRSIILSRV